MHTSPLFAVVLVPYLTCYFFTYQCIAVLSVFFFFPPQCQNILLYRHRIIFFNQLPTDGHLGRFPFFDTINNVTEDSLTNGLLSVEHIPRSGDLGSTSSQVKL